MTDVHVEEFAPFDGPLPGDAVPQGRKAMYTTYGDPRVTYSRALITRKLVVKVDPKWERANMVLSRDLPGGIQKLYCHRLVEPYLREALRRSRIVAPDYLIETIGCFAPRFQRHDPARPLSDHTWGIAVDVNAARNRGYEGRRAGEAPKTDMPDAFVRAWESVGWIWGGRWRPFCDPMHFQLRRL